MTAPNEESIMKCLGRERSCVDWHVTSEAYNIDPAEIIVGVVGIVVEVGALNAAARIGDLATATGHCEAGASNG